MNADTFRVLAESFGPDDAVRRLAALGVPVDVAYNLWIDYRAAIPSHPAA